MATGALASVMPNVSAWYFTFTKFTAPVASVTGTLMREMPSAHLIPAQRLPSTSRASDEIFGLAMRLVASSTRLPDESTRMSPFAAELIQAVPSPNATIADTRSSTRWLGIT